MNKMYRKVEKLKKKYRAIRPAFGCCTPECCSPECRSKSIKNTELFTPKHHQPAFGRRLSNTKRFFIVFSFFFEIPLYFKEIPLFCGVFDWFQQAFGCPAPEPWSKYTTPGSQKLVSKIIELNQKYALLNMPHFFEYPIPRVGIWIPGNRTW